MPMDDQRFDLLDDHVTLLRAMYVGWDDGEFGAPEIDPKRPYGNSDVLRDIHEILSAPGGAWDDEHGMPANLTPHEWAELKVIGRKLHAETQTALQIVLVTGSFEPGTYVAPAYTTKWSRVAA